MQVNQSLSEDVLPHQASGPASVYCPSSAERLYGIDQKLRQTAQLVSLVVGQLEACEFDPTTPARRVLEQLDATVEKLLSRFGLDQPSPPSVTQPCAHKQLSARALSTARICLLLIVEPDALLCDMLSCGLGSQAIRR